jgi:hypothetical protein
MRKKVVDHTLRVAKNREDFLYTLRLILDVDANQLKECFFKAWIGLELFHN